MILADGCFDPLHMGHVRYLRAAAECDASELWVRVAPDDDIHEKGRQTFQTLDERMELIKALGYCPISTATLARAIHKLKPSVLVKGDDWRGRLPAEVLAACEECGTMIAYTHTGSKTSTQRLA